MLSLDVLTKFESPKSASLTLRCMSISTFFYCELVQSYAKYSSNTNRMEVAMDDFMLVQVTETRKDLSNLNDLFKYEIYKLQVWLK